MKNKGANRIHRRKPAKNLKLSQLQQIWFGGKEKRLRYRGPEGIWSESREKAEKNLVKAAKRHKWLKVVENDECC